LPNNKPIIALLAGSRKQEIKDNLPAMIQAASAFTDYQMVLAGAPSIDKSYYLPFIEGQNVTLIENSTYALLSHATAALVTSGTATNVPQVVCYKTPIPPVIRFAFNHIIKVKYISLVNLILDKEAVPELFADRFVVSDIQKELQSLLIGGDKREDNNYEQLHAILGNEVAHDNAARIMFKILNDKTKQKKEE